MKQEFFEKFILYRFIDVFRETTIYAVQIF
jgi:hypothetical protein